MTANFHVLLIEDDPAVAQSLQEGLRREGYAVAWKTQGVVIIQKSGNP